MKKITKNFTILLCILIFGLTSTISFAQEDAITDTVQPFFEALKAGDVRTIEDKIDGKLFNQLKVLLRENTTYPDFLRKRYSNVSFEIKDYQTTEDNMLVYVTMSLPSGNSMNMSLNLTKNSANNWKIIEQSTQR